MSCYDESLTVNLHLIISVERRLNATFQLSFISDASSNKEVGHFAGEIVVSGYKHLIQGDLTFPPWRIIVLIFLKVTPCNLYIGRVGEGFILDIPRSRRHFCTLNTEATSSLQKAGSLNKST